MKSRRRNRIKSRKSKTSRNKIKRRTRKWGGANGELSNSEKSGRKFLCNSKLEQIKNLEIEIIRLKKDTTHCNESQPTISNSRQITL